MTNHLKDNRVRALLDLVPDRVTVLNVGCAQNPQIHFALAKKTDRIVGIDINKKMLSPIKRKRLPAYVMNAESIRLNRKFDYIVAGELIEHLSNPGLFLEGMKRHLAKSGKIIITTPNISSVFLYFLVVVLDQTQDPTHTFYFDQKNLKTLIQRFGLEIVLTKYIPPEIKFHGRGILFRTVFFITTCLVNLGYKISPRLFGSYLLMVLHLKEK